MSLGAKFIIINDIVYKFEGDLSEKLERLRSIQGDQAFGFVRNNIIQNLIENYKRIVGETNKAKNHRLFMEILYIFLINVPQEKRDFIQELYFALNVLPDERITFEVTKLLLTARSPLLEQRPVTLKNLSEVSEMSRMMYKLNNKKFAFQLMEIFIKQYSGRLNESIRVFLNNRTSTLFFINDYLRQLENENSESFNAPSGRFKALDSIENQLLLVKIFRVMFEQGLERDRFVLYKLILGNKFLNDNIRLSIIKQIFEGKNGNLQSLINVIMEPAIKDDFVRLKLLKMIMTNPIVFYNKKSKKENMTPLMATITSTAIKNDRIRIKIIDLLLGYEDLDFNVQVKIKNFSEAFKKVKIKNFSEALKIEGKTALMLSITTPSIKFDATRLEIIKKLLLNPKIDVNLKDAAGDTALSLSVLEPGINSDSVRLEMYNLLLSRYDGKDILASGALQAIVSSKRLKNDPIRLEMFKITLNKIENSGILGIVRKPQLNNLMLLLFTNFSIVDDIVFSEIFKELKQRGANVIFKDKNGTKVNVLFSILGGFTFSSSDEDDESKSKRIDFILSNTDIDINDKGTHTGNTALMFLLDSLIIRSPEKRFEMFEKMLLKYNADINIKNKENETAISIVTRGLRYRFDDVTSSVQIKMFNTLVERGANLFEKHGNENKRSLLMLAIKNIESNNTKAPMSIIETLLKNNVDLEQKDSFGNTALMYAIEDFGLEKKIQENIIKQLLDKGANVNTKNEKGETAIMKIISMPYKSKSQQLKILKTLLDKKADINAKNEDDDTALLLLSKSSNYNEKNRFELLQFLLQNEADILAQNESKENILMLLCTNDIATRAGTNIASRLELIQFVIDKKIDVNAVDFFGETALHRAVEKLEKLDPKQVVPILLKAGIDVNIQSNTGKTALMFAKDLPMIKLLVQNGADINKQDEDGNSFIMLYIDFPNRWAVGPVLTKRDEEEKIDAIKRIVDLVDISLQNHKGETALMRSILSNATTLESRQFQIIEIFINSFVIKNKPGIDFQDDEGYTALMHTIKKSFNTAIKRKIVRKLISLSKNLELQNNNGETALDLARNQQPRDETIIKLLENKIKLSKKRKDNPTGSAPDDNENDDNDDNDNDDGDEDESGSRKSGKKQRIKSKITQNHCNNCNSIKDLHACGNCKSIVYCSRECQKVDWRNHQKNCKTFLKKIK